MLTSPSQGLCNISILPLRDYTTSYFAKVRLKPEYLLTRGRDEEAIYDVSATSRGTGVGGAARPRQQSPLAYVKTFATLL